MRVLAILAAVCVYAVPSAAEVKPIPVPANVSSYAFDVNARGEVVGSYAAIGGGSVSYFYSPVTGLRVLSHPEAATLQIEGLNDRGDLAGSYTDHSGVRHGFVWTHDGTFETIDVPGRETVVTDVTEDGIVIGYSYDASAASESISAFVRSPEGDIEVLDNPWGLPVTVVQGIADNGTVVGYYRNPLSSGDNTVFGFVRWNDGEWERFQIAGTIDTVPTSISHDGSVIVGFVRANGERRGFISRHDGVTLLGAFTRIEGINEAGLMVGESRLPKQVRPLNAVYFTPAQPVLAVTTPNEAAQWGLRTRQRVSWTFDGDAPAFRIEVSRDAGATWEWLAEVPNKPGRSQNFYWDVAGAATEEGRIRVTALGPEEVSDTNDAAIAIREAAIAATVGARRPVTFGAAETIALRHNLGARKRVVIEVSENDGTAWRTLIVTTTRGATTSSHRWTVDLLPTGRAVVRVRALDGSDASGVSPAFPVVAPASTTSR